MTSTLVERSYAHPQPTHFRRPTEHAFTRAQRAHTTVLLGGLTMRHERLLQAALEGRGYRVALIPTPVKADFQAGKEFGNNGQCNPTYFTTGALVNYLRDLRDNHGLSAEAIVENYVFVTGGACGPCRFGMYEAEYRLAVRNAGFDGFRVVINQQGNFARDPEAGLDMDTELTLALVNAFFLGDLLNEVAYQIRPYEVVAGATNAVMERAVEAIADRLRQKSYDDVRPGAVAKVLGRVALKGDEVRAAKFLEQLRSAHYTDACRTIAEWLDAEVEVDFLKAKPIVKVIGEFWAQTTEGDGNFRMFAYLEREGAEVRVEPVANWLMYLLHRRVMKADDNRGLIEGKPVPTGLPGRLGRELAYHAQKTLLAAARRLLTREYDRLRQALGGTGHRLIDQAKLERLGHGYYNSRSGGGEGHLEVAKNIYYATEKLSHMTLGLKPFGCLPSTQSDGAQAAVVSHFPDILYLPIETSGEGDVNAYSRVQMTLGEAKTRARAEMQAEIEASGYDLDRIRAYVADHRDLRRPISVLHRMPHGDGPVGHSAKFVRLVTQRMRAEGIRATG